MRLIERIIHMVLFEAGAVCIGTLAVLAADSSASGALMLNVLISLTAMAWNFVFNWSFDQVFTAPRETRSWGVRWCQTLFFEGGLLLFTVPLVMYFLDLNFWRALAADVGLSLLIVAYSLAFNWVFDQVRARFWRRKRGC